MSALDGFFLLYLSKREPVTRTSLLKMGLGLSKLKALEEKGVLIPEEGKSPNIKKYVVNRDLIDGE